MKRFALHAGDLDRRVRIERPPVDTSFDRAGTDPWVLVAEVWAGVRDILPSRAEQAGDGVTIARRPTRIRMRFRTDVTADMRLIVEGRPLPLRIVAGPAELGRRDGIELVAEEYSTSGSRM